MAHFRALAIVALAPLLGGCPGEKSNVPAQEAAPRVEITGTVTDGASTTPQFVNAKGTVGTTRQVRASAAGAYTVTLTDLTGPFLLANTLTPGANPDLVVLTTVATRAGIANITPLTTLLTAQLFGLDPGEVIAGFNNSANVKTELVTDANIQAAQIEVTRFLRDAYGVTLKSGSQDFVDTAFNPVAGDPMFDAIQDLNARFSAQGKTVTAVAQQLAQGIRACQAEALLLNVNGQDKKFCPVFKSATPEETDVSIVDYVFRDVVQNTLTLKAQGTTVLASGYQPTNGDPFTCDSACMGISLGAPADDLTRQITYTNAGLSSAAGGAAVFTGTLTSAIPSITLPPLPCADNRFFVIFPNHDVVADCIVVTNPTGIAGTLSGGAGPNRDNYAFQTDTTDPSSPHMEIVLDYSTPDPTVVSVYYSDSNPGTGELRSRFACMSSGCNGVAIGAKTVASAFGFTFEVRTVTLNDTVLNGLNADGTSTGTSVDMRASLTVIHDATTPPTSYPTLIACADPTEDAVDTVATGAEFNICVYPNDLVNGFLYRTTIDLGDGGLELVISGDAGDMIYVFLQNDVLTNVQVQLASTGEIYECPGGCTGVTIGGPDGTGQRTVTFNGTVLHNQQSFPLPGDHTLKLTSPALSIAPP